MNKIFLSICIPTFERAFFLKQCLGSITAQFVNSEVRDQVEVVISDNASADNTEQAVHDYQNIYSNIRYHKNSENIGYDRNALQAISKARGEYIWLLGDDDAIFEGSLPYILPILRSGRYDYFLANGWGYDKEMKLPAVNRPNLLIKKDQAFNALSEYVKSITKHNDLVGNFGGMSSQIFKRKIWAELPEKENFIGTQTIHLFVILKAFKDLPACVIAKPLVKARSDNMRWEIFPGLETMRKRASLTQDTLLWILREYEIPHSKWLLKFGYYKNLFVSWATVFLRKTLFSRQNSRDRLKKILGKL